MKIHHVVTLISPDGRFGGPTRVALDLAAEQVKRGHDVTVFAGSLGYQVQPTNFNGVKLRLFPSRILLSKLGFATLYAPGLLRSFWSASRDADITHIHLARDILTSTSAMAVCLKQLPYVVQTHGMIDASTRKLAKLVDLCLIARILRRADRVWALTAEEENELKRLGATDVELLPNGIEASRSVPQYSFAAVPNVLFLARLHPRKGAMLFVETAIELAQNNQNVEFTVAGPDEGDRERIDELLKATEKGVRSRIHLSGAVRPEDVAELMSKASVYVLPAENEPFGMTLLEAMREGTPVIVHETAQLAETITDGGAGFTFTDSVSLRNRILYIIMNPEQRSLIGKNARKLISDKFSISSIGDIVMNGYALARSEKV